MDLLTLAAICGPWVAPATTVSIIGTESGGHPFAIHDNTSGRSYKPGTVEQAARLAQTLLMSGHRLDLGLMQINANAWFAPARVTLGEAFNPCLNIAFGTTILSAAYARQSGQGLSSSEVLKRALSIYNSGSATRGLAYAEQVLQSAKRQSAVTSQQLLPIEARR